MVRTRKKRIRKIVAAMGPPESTTAMLRLDLLRTYQLAWLPGDLFAALALFAASIPLAMAYGFLAGLHPVNGLYAALLAMGVYAFFGTSRNLIIAPGATASILVATSLAAMFTEGDPARFAILAALQAIIVGGMLLVAGVFRVGFISDFIPKSVVTGFFTGLGLIIILSQVGYLAGIDLKSSAFFPRLWELYSRFREIHFPTLYLGGTCLLVMLAMRSLLPWVPEAAVTVLAATLAAMKWGLAAQGVQLVGDIPGGLPYPAIPGVGFNDILAMLPVAAGVALVSYVDATNTGRSYALEGGYRLDANQELIALGLANLGAGFCHGFAVGPGHTCTQINVSSGGRSQFAVLLAAALLGGFLLYFTGILKNIPWVALSAIIIASGIRLLRPGEFIQNFKTRRASCYVSLATAGAVLIAGLMTGILVAVALAIILVLSALARPHETIFRPKVPGLLVYRFAGPLFFLNAAHFANRVQEVIDSSPKPVTFFLINAEAIVDMDVNAAEILEDLQTRLKDQGITMGICEVKGHFRKMLMSTRLPSRVGFVIYPSVAAAVRELSKAKEENEEKPAQEKEQADEPAADS